MLEGGCEGGVQCLQGGSGMRAVETEVMFTSQQSHAAALICRLLNLSSPPTRHGAVAGATKSRRTAGGPQYPPAAQNEHRPAEQKVCHLALRTMSL